jgi:hypothetical protein
MPTPYRRIETREFLAKMVVEDYYGRVFLLKGEKTLEMSINADRVE